MLPSFAITARHRPVELVGTASAGGALGEGGVGRAPLALLAPFAAVEAEIGPGQAGRAGGAALTLTGPDGATLGVTLAEGGIALTVRVGDAESVHRSRRHGRPAVTPTRVGLTLTGSHLAALTHEGGRWMVRGRVDVRRLGVDTHDPAWCAGLVAEVRAPGARSWTAGGFGQMGLRDVRLVSHADGAPVRLDDGTPLFTATSAGPGFFDTAHTSLWALRGDRVEHRADLFFTRPDQPGVYGDHATHVVRDGGRWLVATSTWADFPADKRERADARLRVTLAETTTDVTTGQHVLTTRELPLPTDGRSVGVWDPHLARRDDGSWLVGFVSARKFFAFHPVLAGGPSLDDLTLLGAATDRRATEGTTLLRVDPARDEWLVLASDGRDNSRRVRGRYPAFDLTMREIGDVAAPYVSNIPWPTLIPPAADETAEGWRMITFDGTRAGGPLPGYGTHGDLVVLTAAH